VNEAKEFVEFMVSSITGDPNCFSVDTSIDENGGLLTLNVSQQNAGRVIGKRGATAKSMRQLLRALGLKNGHRYRLLIDDGVSRAEVDD